MMFQKGDLIKAKHQYKRYNGGTLALMLGEYERSQYLPVSELTIRLLWLDGGYAGREFRDYFASWEKVNNDVSER
jgi:hypothetical protein